METILVFRMQRWDCWSIKLEGIVQAAARRGWTVQTVDAPESVAAAEELLHLWNPKGVIVIEGDRSSAMRFSGPLRRLPVVYLDQGSAMSGRKPVLIKQDARAITRLAVHELLSIGCTSLAYVGWLSRIHWSEDKRESFRETMRLHGRPHLEYAPDGRSELDYSIGLEKFIADLPLNSGILAVNDLIAGKVIATAKSLGREIPDDLAVIGVDNDHALCESGPISISSFALDYAATGEAAVKALEHPDQVSRGIHYIAPLRFFRRRSTLRLKKKDSEVESALERIRREACGGLTAKKVFDGFACSRRMAEIRFRELVGRSVLAEIQRCRLEEACTLLKAHDLPLKVLADRCGFRSGALLQRQFKSQFGLTPRQWRKRLGLT